MTQLTYPGPATARPPHRYPAGTVRALLESAAVTPATREVVGRRLGPQAPAPVFFEAHAYATLAAACRRLVPQAGRERPVDIAAAIDDRLARGMGDGWRYDALPPDGEAYQQGLRGLDELARARGNVPFVELGEADQDAVLDAVARGAPAGGVWAALPPGRFFEEWLAETCECYYSHPLAQEEIGYVGMADAPGWQAIGLGELEEREPRPAGGPDV